METQTTKQDRAVPIRKLKSFAHDRLPIGSSLRDLILSEADELPSSELAVKISVYLKLLKKLGGPDS